MLYKKSAYRLIDDAGQALARAKSRLVKRRDAEFCSMPCWESFSRPFRPKINGVFLTKFLVFLPVVFSLAACSTVPASVPKTMGPAIVFVRDSGAVGSGCTYTALVDGLTVGQLRPGESVVKIVEDGKHKVGFETSTAICPNVKMNKVVEVNGSAVVLRLGTTSNFQFIFDQIE